MLLAVLLRLIPVVFQPSMVWADEIFQTTEQAHRLVYGTGLVPWEFQLHVRSWLLPGVIAGVMEFARLIGKGPNVYLPVIATTFGLLGAAPVVCCFLWCRRRFGLLGAIVGGAAVATMPDLVYFGARTLDEVVSGNLLVIALYALEPGFFVASRRRIAVGGALLGLVFVLRIEVAPGVALLGLWCLLRAPRERLAALAMGVTAVIAAQAVLDTVTLGSPLASIWRYLLYNLGYGVASTFGAQPWYYYAKAELAVWLGTLPVLALLVLVGARRLPVAFWAALTIVLVHSAIGHKEYRFIYPALALFGVLAGLGLAEIVSWCGKALDRRGARPGIAEPACAAIGLICWGVMALHVWTDHSMRVLRALDHNNLLAASYVSRGPPICGLGMFGHDGTDWAVDGGYTWLNRPVPMYWPKDGTQLRQTAPGFDALIYTQRLPPGLGFTTVRCFGKACVARRPGGCRKIPELPMPFPKPIEQLRPRRR